MDRVIFHIDCNAYYASVEELFHPELRGVPMAICGNPKARRGVILAKNELAKGCGVKTAETIWQARSKCPGLVLRPARHGLYGQYSEMVNSIYEQYTDQVERFGIDESFLDVTGSLHLFGGDAVALAHEIRERIPRETGREGGRGLTVSVGVSFNRVFAKLASDMKKPDAVSVITRENYREVVWPMPASALLMVGRATADALGRMNIRTIGELANAPVGLLSSRFGKMGELLHAYANGRDQTPVLHVSEGHALQSVGNGMTFKRNLVTENDIRTAVTALCDSVATRLRRHGLKCASLQVAIKDTNLKVITRQKALLKHTWSTAELIQASLELIEASWKVGAPIRMLTITAQKLGPPCEAEEQLSLFSEPGAEAAREKRERLDEAVDKIRCKFGSASISFGSMLGNDLGINEAFGEEEEP